MVPTGVPPPPKLRVGQKLPPPSPLKPPMLNPVIVMPHWMEPIVLCHALCAAWQILPLTEFRRAVGSRKLVMRLRPEPLKKFPRQERFVTLCGWVMD